MSEIPEPRSALESPEVEARRTAYGLLIARAQTALVNEDFARFDDIMAQLLDDGRRDEKSADRDHKMNIYRVRIALALIGALFLAVVFALSGLGGDGQTTAQYVSLISGLAGIAIGWLYGTSGTTRRRRNDGS